MDTRIVKASLEQKFSDYLNDHYTSLIPDEDYFISTLQSTEDPETGHFYTNHGMTADSIAFEHNCNALNQFVNPQF